MSAKELARIDMDVTTTSLVNANNEGRLHPSTKLRCIKVQLTVVRHEDCNIELLSHFNQL